MILVVALLTPFTMSDSVSLFFAFRIIQTRLMLLAIVHGLNPNQKLKAILEGCANLDHLWGSTKHTSDFPKLFSYRRVCISALHTLTIFNPSSTLDQPFTMYLIGSTAAPASTTSSLMIALSKRNWPYATGGNTKTCSSGPQSLFSPAAPTSGAWNLPSSKSGNHG